MPVRAQTPGDESLISFGVIASVFVTVHNELPYLEVFRLALLGSCRQKLSGG
jgi:hypothetical protein